MEKFRKEFEKDGASPTEAEKMERWIQDFIKRCKRMALTGVSSNNIDWEQDSICLECLSPGPFAYRGKKIEARFCTKCNEITLHYKCKKYSLSLSEPASCQA